MANPALRILTTLALALQAVTGSFTQTVVMFSYAVCRVTTQLSVTALKIVVRLSAMTRLLV